MPPAARGGGSGADGPHKASPAAATFAAERAKRSFYQQAGERLLDPVPLSTAYDAEVASLFFPALVALLLEPLQQLGESLLVGRLGVAGAGWITPSRQ